ncbi:HTH-type transcriptional regulator KipR [Baekduia alba]|uniref:IclR family transcriptional regulator n=1 Tax=Baekduia alba TaxID=2997333 RepID=UPI002341380D|nr:IclR family transcriptional regulator [Baekduia alba]WCB91533.1 HTH-type transcriptional regulator KipR [Baekduia alba]
MVNAHTDRPEPGSSQALDRFAALMSALADSAGPLAAPALAERVGLPASSTYRLVQALEHQGLVERRQRGELSLGLRILEYARNIEERVERTLLEPARPVMLRLAEEHRETVLLTARAANCSIGLGSVESPRPVRLSYERWRMTPMHLGASGKILLAHLDPVAAERVISAIAGPDPTVDPRRLRRELAAIRHRGYVITHSELDEGAGAVAAPILDRRGRLIAGLTIAGPSARIHEADTVLTEGVVAGALSIGAALQRRRG